MQRCARLGGQFDALRGGVGRAGKRGAHRRLAGLRALEKKGYQHRIVFLGPPKQASEIAEGAPSALLKRWLLGTHQGAVSHEHRTTTSTSLCSASTGAAHAAGENSSTALCSRQCRGPNAVSIDRQRLGRRGPVSPTTMGSPEWIPHCYHYERKNGDCHQFAPHHGPRKKHLA